MKSSIFEVEVTLRGDWKLSNFLRLTKERYFYRLLHLFH